MGYVTCGTHNVRCCWRCDRCPKCEPETGRIGRGDYCKDCTAKLKAEGFVWSDYYRDYVKADEHGPIIADRNETVHCGVTGTDEHAITCKYLGNDAWNCGKLDAA